jgi:hypothetical protein
MQQSVGEIVEQISVLRVPLFGLVECCETLIEPTPVEPAHTELSMPTRIVRVDIDRMRGKSFGFGQQLAIAAGH